MPPFRTHRAPPHTKETLEKLRKFLNARKGVGVSSARVTNLICLVVVANGWWCKVLVDGLCGGPFGCFKMQSKTIWLNVVNRILRTWSQIMIYNLNIDGRSLLVSICGLTYIILFFTHRTTMFAIYPL